MPLYSKRMLCCDYGIDVDYFFRPHRKGQHPLHVRFESLNLNGLIHWDGKFEVIG
eukprot:m.170663 g.170663  ORF g.170663 m.170663 type:complete len:55 (+) comp31616_c0_seq9:284-448(+)